MPSTDPEGLDPGLKARLHAELDRIRPPAAVPRYMRASSAVRAWRLAPVVLAGAFVGILALTAAAATGSPNPVVWTQRVQTVMHPTSPSPEVEESPAAPQSHAEEVTPPAQHESPEPSAQPEPREGAETPNPAQPAESPEPSGDHSGDGSPEPSPTPTSDDH